MAESSSSAAATASASASTSVAELQASIAKMMEDSITSRKLVLEGPAITDEVIDGITQLPRYNSLNQLVIAGTSLRNLPKLPSELRHLTIVENPNLRSLPNLPVNLQSLRLKNNPRITRLPSPLPSEMTILETLGTPIRSIPILPQMIVMPKFSYESLREPFRKFYIKFLQTSKERGLTPFKPGQKSEIEILKEDIRRYYRDFAAEHRFISVNRHELRDTARALAEVQNLILMKARNVGVNEEGVSKAVTLPYGVEFEMTGMLGAPLEQLESIYKRLRFTREELMDLFGIPESTDKFKPFQVELEILKNLYFMQFDMINPNPREARYSGYLNFGGARSRKISVSRRMPSQTRRRRAQRTRRNRSMKGGGDYDYCSDLRKKTCPARTNGGKHMFERVESAKMLPKMKCKYCGETCLA